MPIDVSRQSRSNYAARARTNDCSIDAPPIKPHNWRLRKKCDNSLRIFLEQVFPEVFPLEWSPDHLKVIEDIQERIEHGGLKAIGMPRGSGKTSIVLRAGIWGILTGKRRFICIVAADEYSAISGLDTIKTEINHNPAITDLYGYETWALRHLGGEGRRAGSQTWDGEPTGVDYDMRTLCFGSIPGSLTSAARISTAGITGRIRGQQSTTVDGEVIRPDFVICDDPQTKNSAASPSQCQKRHETMMGDVLGLSGPGIKISGFATCTVIYQNDLADRLLDSSLSGDWNGSKISMIKRWPKSLKLWDEYNTLRLEGMVGGGKYEIARKFVRDNFDEMHEGASVYWEARKEKKDVSALQHAMDLYFRDPGVFASEYQNNPLALVEVAPYEVNVEQLMRRVVGVPRGKVPNDVDKITAFIDVQRELLYYCIVAWGETGRGYIIDYGACPDQQRVHWSKSAIAYSLPQVYGDDFETYLRSGLEWLTSAILDNEYTTEDGGKMQVDRLAIDARWGESTHIIRKFCRESRNRSRIHPSMGVFIGANSKEWQKLSGDKKDRKGVHAKLQTPKESGRREMLYDVNYWKSWVADRLCCNMSSPKAIVLFDARPHEHRMFAEHCAWEQPLRVIGKTNNEVVEWKQKALGGTVENDYWDCIVGNAALASTIGVETHAGNRRRVQGRGALLRRVVERTQSGTSPFFKKK